MKAVMCTTCVNLKEGEAVQFMKKEIPNSVNVKLELVDPAV